VARHTAFLFLLLALALPGCGPRAAVPPKGPGPGDAFLGENQAAARTLANLGLSRLDSRSRLLVASFVNRDDLESTSPLGRYLAEETATVLSQAGFEVLEVRLRRELGLRPDQGEFALSRRADLLSAETAGADAVLVGSYTVDSEAILVSARLVRLSDNTLAAAHDWTLPNRGLAARLLRDGVGDAAFDYYLKPWAGAPKRAGYGTPKVETLPGQAGPYYQYVPGQKPTP
jgi:hypothetical protein